MRFFEIFVLKEENDNTKTRKFIEKIQKELKFETIEESKLFHEFLRRMKENTNSKLVRFLFSNSMYRAESPSEKWSRSFGEKRCPTNRRPVSSTPQLQTLIDEHLKSKGFTALRSNSIFVTGDLEFARRFEREGTEIHVIFPSKSFSFTWNSKISDFYIHYVSNVNDILELNYEKMLSNEKEKVLKIFEKILMKVIYYDFRKIFEVLKEIFEGSERELSFQFRKEIENEKNFFEYSDKLENSNEKTIFYKVLNYSKASNTNEKIEHMLKLLNFLSKKNFEAYRSFFENILYSTDKTLHDIVPKYLKIKKNSTLDHFTNSNLEDAIASGREIMINCDVYYYIEYDFFHRHSKKIEKFLDEIPNRVIS